MSTGRTSSRRADHVPDEASRAVRSFDVGALYAALDDKRTQSGPQLARGGQPTVGALVRPERPPQRPSDQPLHLDEHGQESENLVPTRPVHAPVARSGLPRVFSSDGAGSRRSRTTTTTTSAFALPAAGPDRRLRWALKLLYASMDEKRRQDGLTWPASGGHAGLQPEPTHGPAHGEVRHRHGPRHADCAVARPTRRRLRLPGQMVNRRTSVRRRRGAAAGRGRALPQPRPDRPAHAVGHRGRPGGQDQLAQRGAHHRPMGERRPGSRPRQWRRAR